jgi:hypothetical protein
MAPWLLSYKFNSKKMPDRERPGKRNDCNGRKYVKQTRFATTLLFIRCIVVAHVALSFRSFQILVASTELNGRTPAFPTWPTLLDAKPQHANGPSETRFSKIEKPMPRDV